MPFSYSYTIRLADTDAAGVVYFTKTLEICHEAYEASLEAFGIPLPQLVQDFGVALPIVHAEIDFLRPLFWGNVIQVEMTTELINDTEFTINYQILVASNLKASASTRHVCIDGETRKRVSLPTALQEWL